MDTYFEIYVDDGDTMSVHDATWNYEDAKRIADELKVKHPDEKVGVIAYTEVGTIYVSEVKGENNG